jgi:uncharacterized protein (TIRG00374 family)
LKTGHLKIAFTVAVVAAAAAVIYIRTEGFRWGEFQGAFARVRWSWLTASVPLILATYAIRAARWAVMLRPLAPGARFLRLLGATCIGFTAVVLFGRAGEPVRPYLIARQNGVPFSTQIAAWVVERILDLLMILVIFGAALTQVESSGLEPGPKVRLAMEAGGWVAGLTGVLCLAVFAALRMFRGRVRERIGESLAFLPDAARLRIERFLAAFDQGIQPARERAAVWTLLGYSVLEWALVAGAFYCVLRSFPETAALGPAGAIILLGFVSFGGAVQLPGVGGGIQIAAVLVLTELYGVPVEPASGLALLLWAVNFLVIVPVGLLWAMREGVQWSAVRRAGELP